jgi:uncharacterized RDD family membrane protein YckC
MLYDLMLLFGVVVMAAALFPYAAAPAHHRRRAIDRRPPLLLQGWLLAVILIYFGYFWSRGRQTLAMRAWRTRLVRDDGADLSGIDALRRLALATITMAAVRCRPALGAVRPRRARLVRPPVRIPARCCWPSPARKGAARR